MNDNNATKTESPWSEDQVNSLNACQNSAVLHPFTGPNGEILIATPNGWVVEDCGPIVQDWAWNWMTDWQWNWGHKHDLSDVHQLFKSCYNYDP